MRKLLCLLALIPGLCFGSVHTVMVDDNGNQVSPPSGFATIVLNGSPITNWTNCVVTNSLVSSNWSIWPSTTNVNMAGFAISNAGSLSCSNLSVTVGTIGTLGVNTGNFLTANIGVANIPTATIGVDNVSTANISVANISVANIAVANISSNGFTNFTALVGTIGTANINTANVGLVTGPALIVSNATYYGTEGNIDAKFKGAIWWNGTYSLVAATGGVYKIDLSSLSVVANTFGVITNGCWSPGTANSNTYYVDANFSSHAFPSLAPYQVWWRLGILAAGSTNISFYINGDMMVETEFLQTYGSANHIVKMNGDDQLGFFIQSGPDLPTKFTNDDVQIDLNVIATH